MSGHKWVSGTEKYNAYNLEELKESLKNIILEIAMN
ncbi:MAG: hypothetical protein ACJATI_005360 [Halioglobus sp.]|jgi:hypothetical protein